MATVQDQADEHHRRFDYGSRGSEEAARVLHHDRLCAVTDSNPIQRPEFESSNGETSPLARGMDYDKTGYIHSGEGWIRQTCRPQQGKRANWRRKVELSNSMNPTQNSGNQFKELEEAAGNRNADAMELVGYYTGAPAGILQNCLGFAQGSIGQSIRTAGKRCLRFGTCEECVGEPRLRHLRPAIGPTTISKNEQLRLDAATMVVGLLVMGTSSEWPGARCA